MVSSRKGERIGVSRDSVTDSLTYMRENIGKTHEEIGRGSKIHLLGSKLGKNVSLAHYSLREVLCDWSGKNQG